LKCQTLTNDQFVIERKTWSHIFTAKPVKSKPGTLRTLQQCDACRGEFGVFRQVHDSILLWRNEALGSAFSPTAVSIESTVDSKQFVQHERKLTALAALREFFSVSPLGYAPPQVFAALLLCVLGALTISRSWNKPPQLANKETEPKYSQQDFDQAVQKRVDQKIAEIRLQPAALNVSDNAPGIATPTETRSGRHSRLIGFSRRLLGPED